MDWDEFFSRGDFTDPDMMARMKSRFPDGPDSVPDVEWDQLFPNMDRTGTSDREGGNRTINVGDSIGSNDGTGGGSDFILDWLKGNVESWEEYASDLSSSYDKTIESGGVNAAEETRIAGDAGAAVERGLGAAGVQGSLYGGMTPALATAAWQRAGSQVGESRHREMSEARAGKGKLASDSANLYGRISGAGAGVYGQLHGQPQFMGMWGKSDSDTAEAEGDRDLQRQLDQEELIRRRNVNNPPKDS